MTEQTAGNESGQEQQNSGPQQQTNGTGTVALDDATIERIAAASTRQAANNHGQGPSQQQQQPVDNGASSNNQGSNQSDVLTAIQALPEQITRSIKEALGQPASNGAQSNNSGQQQQSGSGETPSETPQEPGKRKSFGDWWFGK